MSKIADAFKEKKAVLGFLTAGDPTLDKTEEYMIEMEKAGAAIIEIGIPFSDPIAEGKTIQAANVRALSAEGGCTTDMVFDMVEKASKKVSVPLVFVAYLNTLFCYGYERFFEKCQKAGVSGIIVQDIPYEEKEEVVQIAKKYDVDIISIVVPASKERIQTIAKNADGYLYLLAPDDDKKVDGMLTSVDDIVAAIKEVTDIPVVVAVRNTTLESSARYQTVADGVIVGNGTVKVIGEHGYDAAPHVFEYVKSIVETVN